MNLNKAFVLGNITRDPELRTTPNGQQVCSFSVATNRTYNNKSTGGKTEEVEFHNIVCWGKTAELVNQYMRRGSQILIEGRIQTQSWEGKDGKKNYKTQIVAESVQFGAKPKTERAPDEPAPLGPGYADSAPSDDFMSDTPPATQPTEDLNVEDIPF